ncbi:MAG: HEPN domain-containing protein [Deltaproteobacteria bacterium]|nr:HEPN domain-containing protein [Deltaproteobacteria bacterium]
MSPRTPVGAVESLALARDTLAAAETLARAGFARHAVGRSYYAVFHAACALLATVGLAARTHEGVRSLVNEHFVRTGLLATVHARTLRQIAGDRNDADYDAAATFTVDDAAEDLERARAFVDAVAAIVEEPAG